MLPYSINLCSTTQSRITVVLPIICGLLYGRLMLFAQVKLVIGTIILIAFYLFSLVKGELLQFSVGVSVQNIFPTYKAVYEIGRKMI